MTRGKRQQIVQPRRANDLLEADLGTYQRRVRDLTAEVKQLREQLGEQLRTHQQTERRLRAERDQGVAPKVDALEELLAARTRERDDARKTAGLLEAQRTKITRRLAAWLMSRGATYDDTLRAVGYLAGTHVAGDLEWERFGPNAEELDEPTDAEREALSRFDRVIEKRRDMGKRQSPPPPPPRQYRVG